MFSSAHSAGADSPRLRGFCLFLIFLIFQSSPRNELDIWMETELVCDYSRLVSSLCISSFASPHRDLSSSLASPTPLPSAFYSYLFATVCHLLLFLPLYDLASESFCAVLCLLFASFLCLSSGPSPADPFTPSLRPVLSLSLRSR